MGSFSITHWLIFLGVIVLIFGTSKLKNVGKDVGSAIKDFKDAVQDETKEQVKKNNKVIKHNTDNNTVATESSRQETNITDES